MGCAAHEIPRRRTKRELIAMPQTLFDKIWDAHIVRDLGDGWALLHIDRHLLHDLSGSAALRNVKQRGQKVRNPELVFATPDHAVSSAPGRTGTTFPVGARLDRKSVV